ncbi:heterokaryon incompatibility protein-domain-containing protein [Cladorrhinum samala]|uniref:Heterokaryon incompatibility protein-domain-containing protein n=1 Tax=Cladorrhinum samala TaxID=585594 RepID=A0AAV9HZV8_9PEZI|nr:heterokaryon incompatibility protein-domain-containing protein [Cladorrhinum samala]
MSNHLYAGRTLELDQDDSFRLLELRPGNPAEPVKIRLLNSRVSAAPAYEALSYTWGDTSLAASIRAVDEDGVEQESGMTVTANCCAALKRLRRPDQARLLWVDAVCINQSLIPERNHQIALMTRIYRSASRVVVYLGEQKDDSDGVISYFRELDSPSEYGEGSKSSPDPATLRAFFKRPWFHRVWVLQEISFANQAVFVCGENGEVDWAVLQSFYHFNVSKDRRERIDLPFSMQYAATGKTGRRVPPHENATTEYHWRLQDILVKSRRCRATDPRDKVYAILSLVEADFQEALREHESSSAQNEKDQDTGGERNFDRIIPDYSLSAAQIYTQVAAAILPTVGLQQLLALLGSKQLTPGLPSWVPDWACPFTYSWGSPHLATRYVFAGFKTPRRSDPENEELTRLWSLSPASTSPDDSLPLLRIRAIKVSTISVVGPVCSIAKNYLPVEAWESLTLPEHHVPEPKPPNSTHETTHAWWNGPKSLKPFYRCLSADGVVYPSCVDRAVEMIKEYNSGLDDLVSIPSSRSSSSSSPEDEGDEAEDEDDDDDGPAGGFFTVKHMKPSAWRTSKEQAEHPPGSEPLREIFRYITPSYRIQSDTVLAVCDGKALARLEDGKIGMVPGRAAAGDEVWVVAGVNMPFVCRRMATHENKHGGSEGNRDDDGSVALKLVGSAYVYGVMAGQAWEGGGGWETITKEVVVC